MPTLMTLYFDGMYGSSQMSPLPPGFHYSVIGFLGGGGGGETRHTVVLSGCCGPPQLEPVVAVHNGRQNRFTHDEPQPGPLYYAIPPLFAPMGQVQQQTGPAGQGHPCPRSPGFGIHRYRHHVVAVVVIRPLKVGISLRGYGSRARVADGIIIRHHQNLVATAAAEWAGAAALCRDMQVLCRVGWLGGSHDSICWNVRCQVSVWFWTIMILGHPDHWRRRY